MEKIPNFHDVSEERKELRRAIQELDIKDGEDSSSENVIFEKHYKGEKEALDKKASGFKIADFGGLNGAKETLRKQKSEHEEKLVEGFLQIDKETILNENPDIADVLNAVENISDLKDFRMRRMLEMLDKRISLATRKRNESVLNTVQTEIEAIEDYLEQVDQITLRKAELIKYKENLGQNGHICVTPSVEKALDAISDRRLTGKTIFLHGPTGTGKTSFARFESSHSTGKDPEMVFCNP